MKKFANGNGEVKKHDDKEIVRFGFLKRPSYWDKKLGADALSEVKGEKTLKLFRSWYKLAIVAAPKSRYAGYAAEWVCGVVEFAATGETWIWQPKSTLRRNRFWNGGWQRVR